MRLDNRGLDSVHVWATARPGEISRRFYNILLREVPELAPWLDLFALDAPPHKGAYRHHDGWRTQ